jgi:hypothetical protein
MNRNVINVYVFERSHILKSEKHGNFACETFEQITDFFFIYLFVV